MLKFILFLILRACSAKHTVANGYHNNIIMVGNFRRVLIFEIFVVDLAVTKFSPMKINDYS